MIIESVCLIALSLIVSGCNIQNSFLYFPTTTATSAQELKVLHLTSWQSSTTDFRGFVATNEGNPSNGTVIVFHGNAGRASDRAFYINELAVLGYRVILAEYPGYGGRLGNLGEKAFVADGLETVRLAYGQYGGPLFLLGESQGCGVAAAIAKETTIKLSGIVMITPWDTLLAVAQSRMPFLPVRLLLKDKYNSISNLRSFAGRIAIVGAGEDEIIPIKHARKLMDSLPGAGMWIIPGAGHNDWPSHTSTQWWQEIMDFVSSRQPR